jgi:hypothetical protein
MDKTISGITGNLQIKMYKYLHFNILIAIALLVSCNNPSDLSLEKNNRKSVVDAQGAIHLYVDSASSQNWMNQLIKHYPLDSNLFFQNRYLSAHSFVLHSSASLDISQLSSIRIGFIENYKPSHFDSTVNLQLGKYNLIAYKNPCATGQWLIDIGNTDVNSLSKLDWVQIKKFIQNLSDNLGLEGYFERNHPTDYVRSIQSEIESIWGISVQIPNDWKIFGTDSGFLWLGKLNPTGGFSSLWITKIAQTKDRVNLNEHFSLRNRATKNYFHNDEGTKMVISEIPIYQSKEIENNLFQGWYTEEATTRRGPYFTKYIFNPREKHTLLIDVFCTESDNMSNDVEFLKHLIKTVSFVP